jgi:hypothetical protein
LNPYPFEAPAYQSIRYYRFFTENGTEYNVQFARDQHLVSKVYMDLSLKNEEDEYATVKNGDPYKIMATVLAILQDYLAQNNMIRCVIFTAVDEEDHEENRRLLLFERFCKQFRSMDGWNYQIENATITLTK